MISNRLTSREHASLELGPEGLVITDLGSANGTKVNGEPISAPRVLSAGDSVTIGSDVLEVDIGEAPQERNVQTARDIPREEADSVTHSNASPYDLLDALVVGLREATDPTVVARPVRAAIDAVIENIARTGASPEDKRRVLAAIDAVTSRFDDAESAAWRGRAHDKLGSF